MQTEAISPCPCFGAPGALLRPQRRSLGKARHERTVDFPASHQRPCPEHLVETGFSPGHSRRSSSRQGRACFFNRRSNREKEGQSNNAAAGNTCPGLQPMQAERKQSSAPAAARRSLVSGDNTEEAIDAAEPEQNELCRHSLDNEIHAHDSRDEHEVHFPRLCTRGKNQ